MAHNHVENVKSAAHVMQDAERSIPLSANPKPEKPKTRLNPKGGRELKSSGIYPKKVKR